MNDDQSPSPLHTGGRRRRAAWLLAGTVLTVVALLAGIAMVGNSIWAAVSPWSVPQGSPPPAQSTVFQTEQQGYPQPPAHLDIEVPSGDVTVLAADPERMDIERTLHWSGAEPAINESRSGDTLQITVDCPHTTLIRNQICKVDHSVQAPPGVAADIQTAAGDIEVSNLEGALALATNAGTVTLVNVTGSLTVRGSAGDVTGTGLASSDVEVRLDAGTVDLRFDSAPDRVVVEATAGNVTVEVPAGDAYQVRADTVVGTQQVEVTADPDADRLIEVRTTTGDVRVRHPA